jgi:hypothetical protein
MTIRKESELDVTGKIGDDGQGACIDLNTGVLTIYNQGGHDCTTCDLRRLLSLLRSIPQFQGLDYLLECHRLLQKYYPGGPPDYISQKLSKADDRLVI